MGRYSYDWPYSDYTEILEVGYGSKPNKIEKEYLRSFIDRYYISSDSKIIYYNAVYMFKRWIPISIVHFVTVRKVRKCFIDTGAPLSIQELYKEFADLIVQHAFRAYCK